jgi:TRAP-type C4-dicarboxylate transport system permease small subunit
MQQTTNPDTASTLDRACSAYLHASGLALRVLGVAALALMVGSHALEIVWRLLYSRGLSWVHEFSLIAAMVLYFLMYAEIAKQRDYVRLDLLEQRLPEAARRHLSTFIRLVVLVFHALVAWYAVGTARFAAAFDTTVLEWPETVFYLPLALGCADIVLTETIHLWRHLRGQGADDRAVRRALT